MIILVLEKFSLGFLWEFAGFRNWLEKEVA
jgi:hypothetical protein